MLYNYKDKDYYRKLFLSNDKFFKTEESKVNQNDTTNNPIKKEEYKDIDFLEVFKNILELENPVEKENKSKLMSLKEIIDKDNYVITRDNFKKMMLILYRISADIPVILMGETGWGKTGLIRKLYQLLNNGEEMDPNKNIIKVDSSITDENLIEKMNEINDEAEKVQKEKNRDFWVLFDEINTCNSLGLLNEIFINRSYNGIKLKSNIRLIGTCNPYRLKTDKEDISGLTHPFKNKNLAYDVNLLPQSLMYLVFNFGSLKEDDEDKYIFSILSNSFKKFDKELINLVKEIISKCHHYLRDKYGDSIVSLREIKRFIKLYFNLEKYFKNKYILNEEQKGIKKENNYVKKNKKKNKIDNKPFPDEKIRLFQIKSLIITTYLSYYIRLIDSKLRSNFEAEIKQNLTKLANYYYEKEEKEKLKNINKEDAIPENNKIETEKKKKLKII